MIKPVFAVVGHVNKGKSSIVATLTEDDSVAIAYEARTTTEVQEFPVRIDGETMITLMDTPGFEQARHALAWMRQRETTAVNRREVVEAFVREHERKGEFQEECRLLKPILEGAGILYVVDGSRPFSPEYEAEMEILRWTGQPRLAVINRIGEKDFSREWLAALDQYFSLVREFDAHEADFGVRMQILQACRELRAEWRPALDAAIQSMEKERARRRRESARLIASMLVDQLSLRLDKRLTQSEQPPPTVMEKYKGDLRERYRDNLRELERKCRDQIEDLYQHRQLKRQEADLEMLTEDLFSESTWLRLGLSREQLATTGALGGAIVGGGIDASLAGHSFFLGTVIGGAIGGLTAWLSRDSLSKVEIKGLKFGGRLLTIGPIRNPQFPWIVLDRAILHHRMIARRAHARRDELVLENDAQEGLSASMPLSQRRHHEALYHRASRAKTSDERGLIREELAGRLEDLLAQ